ncbi:MAG: hypothetical protein AAFV80_13835 [Bacteroidota bacterium]
MPISQTGFIFQLVKSLSKSEKRNFRLYVNRIQGGEGIKFVELFDVLDKQKVYDEEAIYTHFRGMSKTQFSNLKRHLYRQILVSLRQVHIQRNVDIQIREQIDYAKILYGKGLYMQSLKLLERAKAMAEKSHADLLHLEIAEFEKQIEARHITRSRKEKERIPALIQESERRSQVIFNRTKLTNLKLEMHGIYIEHGHADKEEAKHTLTQFRDNKLPPFEYPQLTFFEKVDYHQIQVWYYYVLQNYTYCYRHAKHWIDLFMAQPNMQMRDPDLFMRGFHYLLTSAYNMNKPKHFTEGLAQFEAFNEANRDKFKINSRILSYIYRYQGRLNRSLMRGDFAEGLQHLPRIERRLKRYQDHMDVHRVMIFKYKIAALFLGIGNFDKALDYLNDILDHEGNYLRKDIYVYSKLMSLIIHYELNNLTYLNYLVDQTARLLAKQNDVQETPKAILKCFRTLLKKGELDVDAYLAEQLAIFEQLKTQKRENRAFIYLDLTLWLKARLNKCTVEEIVQRRIQESVV